MFVEVEAPEEEEVTELRKGRESAQSGLCGTFSSLKIGAGEEVPRDWRSRGNEWTCN